MRSTSAFASVLLLAGCVGELRLERPEEGRPVPRVFFDAGPPGSADAGPGAADRCGDTRRLSQAVHFGTPTPSYLPLTDGQTYAVASFRGCSGLLVAPRWVLSAKHCQLRAGSRACFDVQAQSPSQCFTAAAAHHHPSADLTLLELTEDVPARFAAVEPVPISYADLDASWVGRTVEAGGYGQQENGGFNEREFVVNTIDALQGDQVVVDEGGERGVCRGDSGGPLMALMEDGSPRVIAAVHGGDGTCTYQASFTRVDPYRDWIEGLLGPTPGPAPAGCGAVTAEGSCVDGAAVYCAGDARVRDPCAASCGWDEAAAGFRCLSGPDPCAGLSPRGRCDGQTARWCEDGQPRARDCAACGQTCDEALPGGAYCG